MPGNLELKPINGVVILEEYLEDINFQLSCTIHYANSSGFQIITCKTEAIGVARQVSI